MANIDYTIIGGERKDPIIYTIVDKIEGKSVEKISQLPLEAKEKIDDFYAALIQYYFDTYEEGGDWWWDFNNDQIVYGHKSNEENRVYIVDVEPMYFKNYRFDEKDLFAELINMISYIQDTEKKFSPPIELTHAREKISDIAANISERTLNKEGKRNFQELKERLSEWLYI